MGPFDIIVGVDDTDVGEERNKSVDRADRKASVGVKRTDVYKRRAGP